MPKEPPRSNLQPSRRLQPYQASDTPTLALRVVATAPAVTVEDEDVPPGRNVDNRWNHMVHEPFQSSEVSARVLLIKDFSSETTESQGYVLMATRRDAVLAQEIIDGQEFMGQIVSVDIVRHGECPEVTDSGFLATLDKQLSDGPPVPMGISNPYQYAIEETFTDPHQDPAARNPSVPPQDPNTTTSANPFEDLQQDADKDSIINTWLATLPNHPSEYPPLSLGPVHGTAVYHDWLCWYEDRGRHFLLELDKYELQHRTIGLKYHTVPYALRHTPAHRDGAAINPTVLDRLSRIYETNTPTHQQRFYGRWLRVRGAVECAVEDIRRMDGNMQTQLLRETHKRVVSGLNSVLGDLRHIEESLESLNRLVETIWRRRIYQRNGDLMESLRNKHSSGGSCFRRWIWTFGEVQSLRGVHLPSYVENVAQELIEGGVEMGRYWRSSVP